MSAKHFRGLMPRAYLKGFSPSAMTAEAVLTYPGPDRQGDDVRPDGGDWSRHRDDPALGRVVNFDHGAAVGRATKPDGSYGVELRQIDDAGKTLTLPVGTTRFFQTAADCRGLVKDTPAAIKMALGLAGQTFEMVADDLLTGVSMEFFPDAERFPKSMRPIGKSPIEDRDAYRFDRWLGVGWAHCFIPVNDNARTLLPAAFDKAMKAARDGSWRGKALFDPIKKSLSPLLAGPRRATVRGGYAPLRKSMNDELPPSVEEPADEMPMSEDVPAANGPTPSAMHEVMQAMQDLKAMADNYASTPDLEHPGGKERFAELAQLLADEIAKFQADASGMFPDAGFEAAEPDADAEPESDEDPFPTTDDGALKTKAFKKGYPRRFRKSDLKAKLPAGKVLVDETAMKELLAAVKRATPVAR